MHCIFDFPKGIPYDYSCPVVQEFINRRLCSTCGLYLASLKELASHKKLHKENEEQSQRNENDPPPPQEPRRRPQRIAARRQRELLCAFQFQELEWAEMDDVDTEGLVIPDVTSVESGTPVIESQEPYWSED